MFQWIYNASTTSSVPDFNAQNQFTVWNAILSHTLLQITLQPDKFGEQRGRLRHTEQTPLLESSMPSKTSIAIVGAGPAGLTLARLLQESNLPNTTITIFEKDASARSRVLQGGTLDLHAETGLAALREMNLFSEFLQNARYDGDEMVLADKNATAIIHKPGSKPPEDPSQLDERAQFAARPEIDRTILQDILLASIDTAKTELNWDKKLQRVDAKAHILHFADGSTAGPFTLIVGCDGAWSKVRPVLTDVRPHYSGVSGMEMRINDCHDRFPDISKMVGSGMYACFGDNRMISAQRLSGNQVRFSSWGPREESWPQDVIDRAGGDIEKVKEAVLAELVGWDPTIRKWIEPIDMAIPWPLYELPVGHTWEHKKGYTLISDAAHLMTPFSGEGVNIGMKDALELSKHIIKALKEDGNEAALDDAIAQYEVEAFPRAKRANTETMTNKTTMFRDDSPVGMVVTMVQGLKDETRRGEGPPGILGKLIFWLPVVTIAWAWCTCAQQFGIFRRKLGQTLGYRG